MSQQYRFQPTTFKRINFYFDWTYAIGLGASISLDNMAIELPFIKFEIVFYSKKDLEKYNKIANYFSTNANLLED